MNLYLDDDLDANELVSRLQHEGHEVISPRAVSMSGAEDEAHLNYAAAQNLPLLTANTRDFLALHQAWLVEGREHAGLLLLYRENNAERDMTYGQIARAVSRFEQSDIPLYNTYQNLNMWRALRL